METRPRLTGHRRLLPTEGESARKICLAWSHHMGLVGGDQPRALFMTRPGTQGIFPPSPGHRSIGTLKKHFSESAVVGAGGFRAPVGSRSCTGRAVTARSIISEARRSGPPATQSIRGWATPISELGAASDVIEATMWEAGAAGNRTRVREPRAVWTTTPLATMETASGVSSIPRLSGIRRSWELLNSVVAGP